MIDGATWAIAIATFVIGFCAGMASLSLIESRFEASCDRIDGTDRR